MRNGEDFGRAFRGGHRTLFALGALQYLADAGKNIDVSSIASVSGGSLTSGVATFFKDDSVRGGRAHAVLEMLGTAGVSEPVCDQITAASDSMSTNLSRIDSDAASDVVWHAHVLTTCNAHVLFGFPIEPGVPSRDRFRTRPGPLTDRPGRTCGTQNHPDDQAVGV